MSGPAAHDLGSERAWQDAVGGTLQAEAYARAGTRAVLDGQYARIAALLAPAPEQRVLDLGCGVGHLLAWLATHAPARYQGLDLSWHLLSSARRAAPAAGFTAGDAARLPFGDGVYDGVVCSGAAHHFPDLPGVLAEIHRVLVPGGRLVLHEPADSPLARVVRRTVFRNSPYESPADLEHKHEFTHAGVVSALRAAGFEDVVVRCHDFLAYPLSGVYMALPWSRSRTIMRALVGVERGLTRVPGLRPLWDALAWSVVFAARRALSAGP